MALGRVMSTPDMRRLRMGLGLGLRLGLRHGLGLLASLGCS
jgi:hypothetical protein